MYIELFQIEAGRKILIYLRDLKRFVRELLSVVVTMTFGEWFQYRRRDSEVLESRDGIKLTSIVEERLIL